MLAIILARLFGFTRKQENKVFLLDRRNVHLHCCVAANALLSFEPGVVVRYVWFGDFRISDPLSGTMVWETDRQGCLTV